MKLNLAKVLKSPELYIFVIALVLRIYAALDPFLHPWDERYHALVARNLIDNPLFFKLIPVDFIALNDEDWRWSYIWLHKPPLTLWLIAGSLKLFGITELAVRVPSILLGSFGCLLTYKIASQISSFRVGLCAAILHAGDSLLIQLASGRHRTDHVDATMVFFCELAVFFGLAIAKNDRWKNRLAFILSLACAILSKWLLAFMVLPSIFILLFSERRRFWESALKSAILGLSALTIALPWTLYTHYHFPLQVAWESKQYLIHMTESLDGHSGPWIYFIDNMWKLWGRLVFVPLLVGIAICLLSKNFRLIGILAWFLLPIGFFSCVATKMPAYVAIGSPAAFIVIALGICKLTELSPQAANVMGKIAVAAFFLLWTRELKQALFQSPDYAKRTLEISSTYKKVKLNLPANSVLVVASHPIEAMFYFGIPCVSEKFPQIQINKIHSLGYRIFELNADGTTSEI